MSKQFQKLLKLESCSFGYGFDLNFSSLIIKTTYKFVIRKLQNRDLQQTTDHRNYTSPPNHNLVFHTQPLSMKPV